jgi:hypothetical protein
MWSDVVLRAEQLHLLRMLFWGASSVLAGTGLLVLITAHRRGSVLVRQFALQTMVWGAAELAVGAWSYRVLALRDVAGSARLERVAWLSLGLYLGLVAVGVTLTIAAWRLPDRWPISGDAPESTTPTHGQGPTSRTLSAMGAGIAIALQGLALAVLQLFLVAHLSR